MHARLFIVCYHTKCETHHIDCGVVCGVWCCGVYPWTRTLLHIANEAFYSSFFLAFINFTVINKGVVAT